MWLQIAVQLVTLAVCAYVMFKGVLSQVRAQGTCVRCVAYLPARLPALPCLPGPMYALAMLDHQSLARLRTLLTRGFFDVCPHTHKRAPRRAVSRWWLCAAWASP